MFNLLKKARTNNPALKNNLRKHGNPTLSTTSQTLQTSSAMAAFESHFIKRYFACEDKHTVTEMRRKAELANNFDESMRSQIREEKKRREAEFRDFELVETEED